MRKESGVLGKEFGKNGGDLFCCHCSSISHNISLSVCLSFCLSVCLRTTSFIDAFWPFKCIIVALVVVLNLVGVVDMFLAATAHL